MQRSLIVLCAVALLLAVVVPAAGAPPAREPITVVADGLSGTPEGEALVVEFAAFTASHGVEVVLEQVEPGPGLVGLVTGPEPPDMIVAPQVGTILELEGHLVDLGDFVNAKSLRRDFGDYLIDLLSVDGEVLGAPLKADLKSLVWYRPVTFALNDYTVPETFDELVVLSDRMVADGHTPWCNFIESGFATGWMGTDWVEDLLLSTAGPEVYDQWVAHDVPFLDARVETAFERYLQMIDTAGYVFERPLMTVVPFFENAWALNAGDCLMHKQAGFFAAFLSSSGLDLDDFAVFKFPAVEATYGDSVIGGATFLAAVDDRNDVRLLARFLLSHRFGRVAMADLGGWILPNVRFDTSRYGDDLTRSLAEMVQASIEAEQFRLDGSDLMPAPVGAGTFWQGIVDLVDGVKTIPQVLADIDASWPS